MEASISVESLEASIMIESLDFSVSIFSVWTTSVSASGTAFEFSKSSFVGSSAGVSISLVTSGVSVASSAVSAMFASERLKKT